MFFYLLYQDMQKGPLPCEEIALVEEDGDENGVDIGEVGADDPTEAT